MARAQRARYAVAVDECAAGGRARPARHPARPGEARLGEGLACGGAHRFRELDAAPRYAEHRNAGSRRRGDEVASPVTRVPDDTHRGVDGGQVERGQRPAVRDAEKVDPGWTGLRAMFDQRARAVGADRDEGAVRGEEANFSGPVEREHVEGLSCPDAVDEQGLAGPACHHVPVGFLGPASGRAVHRSANEDIAHVPRSGAVVSVGAPEVGDRPVSSPGERERADDVARVPLGFEVVQPDGRPCERIAGCDALVFPRERGIVLTQLAPGVVRDITAVR